MSSKGRSENRGSYSNQNTRDIVCPFFKSHNGLEINCEGYTDAMVCCMKYRLAADKRQQQTIYCEGKYRYCEHYNALMMFKYNDMEG